ncbi:cystatin-like [Pantherophis guttatus]|uniref:Cystatin-like n=1 Tax=Pantherophis guttatus TaxID=94885 RepID=A0A6P9CJJ0_PANGU|nr:cystatin-like [Pantherophis guttatus]
MGIAGKLSDVPVFDSGVREALAFTMQQYNQRRRQSSNVFKVLNVLKVQSQLETRDEYDFMVQVVETECQKWAAQRMDFETIQNCQQLPGNQIQTCYFKVILRSPANLAVTACSSSGLPKDLFNSG